MQTREYRAPEIILGEEAYDHSIDVWSAGCVLAEILAVSDVFTTEIASEKNKD